MHKRTILAILAAGLTGLFVYGVQFEPSAVAASQDDGAEVTEQDAQSAGEQAAAEDKKDADAEKTEDNCPTTAKSKLRMILRELQSVNHAEIQSGGLALARSKAGPVREYAGTLIRDHQEAARRFDNYAKRNEIDLSQVAPVDPIHASVERADRATREYLQNIDDSFFDAAFIGAETAHHRLALSMVLEGEQYATDEAKDLLGGMHRILAVHLALAEKLGENLRFEPKAVGGGPSKGEKQGGSDAGPSHGDGSGDSGSP